MYFKFFYKKTPIWIFGIPAIYVISFLLSCLVIFEQQIILPNQNSGLAIILELLIPITIFPYAFKRMMSLGSRIQITSDYVKIEQSNQILSRHEISKIKIDWYGYTSGGRNMPYTGKINYKLEFYMNNGDLYVFEPLSAFEIKTLRQIFEQSGYQIIDPEAINIKKTLFNAVAIVIISIIFLFVIGILTTRY